LIKTALNTEEELVRQLQLHEEQAFQYLYDHYSKSLFTVICQLVTQQEAAEDVLQQVFIKIWKNIHLYDVTKGRLFTWMLNIARNQAIDFTRSREFNKSGKTIALSEDVYTDREVSSINVRDIGLGRVLESLPEDSRKVLELSFFSGYSHQEIATMLQLPLGTVKTKIRAIIKELRKRVYLKDK
jgi:RNA polymerase sigma factor (sigma-70 family)